MTSWKWAIQGHCIKDIRAAMLQTAHNFYDKNKDNFYDKIYGANT